MNWRSYLFSRQKRALLHTVIVFVISLTCLSLGEGIGGVASNAITTIFYFPFYSVKDKVSRLANTADANDALRASLADFSVKMQFYDETIAENKRLRALLDFVPLAGFRTIPAKIIAVSGTSIPNAATINLGEKDRVRSDQVVISRDGLAGRIASVMRDYSVVYLLTEPRCRVAARISRSREQGIIHYNMERGMFLDNMPRHGDVVVGDTITTSGLGGIFPAGLVIGYVSGIESPENEFFYNITVQPAVNFNALDELYVLMRE